VTDAEIQGIEKRLMQTMDMIILKKKRYNIIYKTITFYRIFIKVYKWYIKELKTNVFILSFTLLALWPCFYKYNVYDLFGLKIW